MDQSKKVTIHIGLHKTATTFLQNKFFPLYAKESGYINLRMQMRGFLNYLLDSSDFDFDLQKAHSLFLSEFRKESLTHNNILISDEQFCGSPWDNAVSRKRYFDRLNSVFSDARYIIVLRNQEDMICSLYLQYIKTGGSANWKEFLYHKKHPLSVGLKSYLDYGVYIEYMVEKVGVGRVGCFFYEDMRREPFIFLSNLASFAGFEISDKTNHIIKQKQNPSISAYWVCSLLLINKFFRSYRQPFLMLPFSMRSLLLRLMIKASFSAKKAIIPRNEVVAFCEHPKRNNSIIKNIYSKDISELGY